MKSYLAVTGIYLLIALGSYGVAAWSRATSSCVAPTPNATASSTPFTIYHPRHALTTGP
jgi:hypothetical protein